MATGPGRVALLTGANRGLGLETARQLLDRGLRVVMTGRDEGAVRRALASLAADEGAVLRYFSGRLRPLASKTARSVPVALGGSITSGVVVEPRLTVRRGSASRRCEPRGAPG